MQNSGVLQVIRGLVVQGRSSRELIDMGYAPGSVYKAQRQVRRQSPAFRGDQQRWAGRALTEGESRQAEITPLQGENSSLRHEASALRDQIARLQRSLEETQQALDTAIGNTTQLREERHDLRTHLVDAKEQLDESHRELAKLRPLRVWAGHPCATCGEPLEGIVDRSVAAKLLQNLAHRHCAGERPTLGLLPTLWEPPLISAE